MKKTSKKDVPVSGDKKDKTRKRPGMEGDPHQDAEAQGENQKAENNEERKKKESWSEVAGKEEAQKKRDNENVNK